MAIRGLNKSESECMAKFADGNFEHMLRMCHDFGEDSITIRDINGIYTAKDANQKIVTINFYCGDPDDFDDTVYVYDGEVCEYVHRSDDGKYRKDIGDVPEAYKTRFDSALKEANNKGVSRKHKKLLHL